MRQRVLTVSGWLVAACVVVAGAGKPGEVRVRRLVVEDERGREVMVLQELNGHPDVRMFDRDGQERISMAVADDDVPFLSLENPRTETTINIGISKNGTPVQSVKRKGVKVPRN